jgi:hypothetical protein
MVMDVQAAIAKLDGPAQEVLVIYSRRFSFSDVAHELATTYHRARHAVEKAQAKAKRLLPDY